MAYSTLIGPFQQIDEVIARASPFSMSRLPAQIRFGCVSLKYSEREQIGRVVARVIEFDTSFVTVDHSGMFPCFLRGPVSRSVDRIVEDRIDICSNKTARVSRGSMMSSKRRSNAERYGSLFQQAVSLGFEYPVAACCPSLSNSCALDSSGPNVAVG